MAQQKHTITEETWGKKPKLEVGKNYKIDLYSFGPAIISGYKVELYPHCEVIIHAFTFKDENNKINYAFFHDNWIREVRGIISYSCISSSSTKCFTKNYFKEELPKRLEKAQKNEKYLWEGQSNLVELLKQLGEGI